MKKVFSVFTLLIAFSFIFSLEAQRVLKVLDEPDNTAFQDIIILEDQSMMALVNNTSSPENEFYLLRLDAAGDPLWSSEPLQGNGLFIKVIDGAIFVGGGYEVDVFETLGVLYKFDLIGNHLWTQTYENEGFLRTMHKQENGNYYLGGKLDFTGSSSNSMLYEVDEEGNLLGFWDFDLYSNSTLSYIFEEDDDLILIFHASTVGVGFTGQVIIRFNPETEQEIWRIDKDLSNYEDDFPVRDVGRFFGAQYNNDGQIVITGPSRGGRSIVYRLDPIGEVVAEFETHNAAYGTHPHDLIIAENGNYLISGSYRKDDAELGAFVEMRAPTGTVIWRKKLERGTFFNSVLRMDTLYLVGMDQSFDAADPHRPLLAKMTDDGQLYDHLLRINLVEDVNNNCTYEAADIALSGIATQIDEETKYAGADGTVEYDLGIGSYTLDLLLPPYLVACENDEEIVIDSDFGVTQIDRLVSRKDCQELRVGLTFTELIRCETNRLYINYENMTPSPVSEVSIRLSMEESLSLAEATLPFDETDGFYIFEIGEVEPFSKGIIGIEVQVPCTAELFSTKCLKVSISPEVSCDPVNAAAGLELTSNCTSDEATVTIKNSGETALDDIRCRLFANGHDYARHILTLEEGEEFDFTLAAPHGNTFTLVSRQYESQETYSEKSISIEGCGMQPNGNFSKGFTRMFGNSTGVNWQSEICAEVLDRYSKNRVFGIKRGRGYYHVIDTTAGSYEFSLRFRNELDEHIERLDIMLIANNLFDRNSFSEIAASHSVVQSIGNSGDVVLSGANLGIAPGEEFHYRFVMNMPTYASDFNGFAYVDATVAANESHQFGIEYAFYNLLASENELTDTISPHSVMEDAYLFGRGQAFDFVSNIVHPDDGGLLIGGTSIEATLGQLVHLYRIGEEEQFLWERSYSFEEGGGVVQKLIAVHENLSILAGYVDDADVPGNYAIDSYAFVLAVNGQGEELWRRVWKPGEGNRPGGSLHEGILLPSGDVVLGGIVYQNNQRKDFLIRIDGSGNTVWENTFTINEDPFSSRFMLKNGIGDEIIYGNHPGFPVGDGIFDFVRFAADGSTLLITQYTLGPNNENGDLTVEDFTVGPDGTIYLVGSFALFNPDPPSVETFVRVVALDYDFGFIESFDAMHEFSILETSSLIARDSFLYIGGAWNPDTASTNIDAFVARLSLDGSLDWLAGKDLGARDYGEEMIVIADDLIYQGVQTQNQDGLYDLQMGYWFQHDLLLNTESPYTLSNKRTAFTVYPNPTADLIRISSSQSVTSVTIYSTTGRVASIGAVSSSGSYDVSHLTAGTYLIMIEDDKGNRHYQNFIKVD